MPGPPVRRAPAARDAGGTAAGWQRFAQELAKLLLQGEKKVARLGLVLRSDGYAKLDEALSVSCMQGVLEAVAPGSAKELNTSGYGGNMAPELLVVAREAISRATTGGKPCFDLWEGEVHGSHQLWVSCAGEPDAESEAPDVGTGWEEETAAQAPLAAPRQDSGGSRQTGDIRYREGARDSPSDGLAQRQGRREDPRAAGGDAGASWRADDAAPAHAGQQPAAQEADWAEEAKDGKWSGDWWQEQEEADGAAAAGEDEGQQHSGGHEAWNWWEKADNYQQNQKSGQGNDEEYLPEPVLRLSRNLASLLRHRASNEGICMRSDGFAKLDEVLSLSCLQRLLDQISPGSAGALNTNGAGGEIDEALLAMVREMVGTSHSKGRPRFELWEGEVSEGQAEIWIRATHKHSMAHITEAPGSTEADGSGHHADEWAEQPQEERSEAWPEAVSQDQSAGAAAAEKDWSGEAWEAHEWTEEKGDEGRGGQSRPQTNIGALLGDSRGRGAGGRGQREASSAARAAAAAAAAAAAVTPPSRSSVVPQRVMAPRTVAEKPAGAEAGNPAAAEPRLLGRTRNEAPAAAGAGAKEHRDAFRDILNKLPKDAPADVRSYLASLAS